MKANFEINVLGNIVKVNIESGNITKKEEFLMNNLPENADPVKAWENKKKNSVLAMKKRTEDGHVFNMFIDEEKIDTETVGLDAEFLKLSISDNIATELLKEYYIKEKKDIKLSELYDSYVEGATYHDVKIAIQMELLSNLEY